MTENERLISIDDLMACLEQPADGALVWRERPRSHFATDRAASIWNVKYAGKPAGGLKKGYRTVNLRHHGLRLQFQAHRIIWALVHGKWPDQHIDHINRDRSDNRLENLRDVAPDVNARNNGNPHGTGLIGAYRRRNGFIAQIKSRYLGYFRTAEEASAAFHRAKADEQDAPGSSIGLGAEGEQ